MHRAISLSQCVRWGFGRCVVVVGCRKAGCREIDSATYLQYPACRDSATAAGDANTFRDLDEQASYIRQWACPYGLTTCTSPKKKVWITTVAPAGKHFPARLNLVRFCFALLAYVVGVINDAAVSSLRFAKARHRFWVIVGAAVCLSVLKKDRLDLYGGTTLFLDIFACFFYPAQLLFLYVKR
jgi:hypothetical protein